MIPKPSITRWQKNAPWKRFSQIEQDLVISRVLVEIFNDEFLNENLAFRGGTALHKLFLNPAPRYSEDIDLVQIKPVPIKPVMQRIDDVITFFEESRRTEVKGHGAKVLYRNELLGTKLRALFQRSKGRDLFDLDYSRKHMELNLSQVIDCFRKYITFSTGKKPPSRKEFTLNMDKKQKDPGFLGDMEAIIRSGVHYDQDDAFEWLRTEVITLM